MQTIPERWLVETTKGVAGVNEATVQWWLIPQSKAATADEAVRYVGADPEHSFATLDRYESDYEEGNETNVPVALEMVPEEPTDDGSCDPLYGQRMDDADLGRN